MRLVVSPELPCNSDSSAHQIRDSYNQRLHLPVESHVESFSRMTDNTHTYTRHLESPRNMVLYTNWSSLIMKAAYLYCCRDNVIRPSQTTSSSVRSRVFSQRRASPDQCCPRFFHKQAAKINPFSPLHPRLFRTENYHPGSEPWNFCSWGSPCASVEQVLEVANAFSELPRAPTLQSPSIFAFRRGAKVAEIAVRGC